MSFTRVFLAAGLFLSLALMAQAGDEWASRTAAVEIPGRAVHTAVWTGEEMIVWGGEGPGVSFNSGARFSAKSNSWTVLSTVNAPVNRSKQLAVWTGTEMIVWGGYNGEHLNSGGRYNPKTDTWRPTATSGAPSGRAPSAAVWTGTEMIIWGGSIIGTPTVLGDGAIYNPIADQWRPMSLVGAPSARGGCQAVWTGSEMIVWGGNNAAASLADGAIYNPQTDTWRPVSQVNAPSGRTWILDCIWTGAELIVWGGASIDLNTSFNDGARYNPTTDTWTRMSDINAPASRNRMALAWTGKELVVFGGAAGVTSITYLNSGAKYDVQTDTWTPLSSTSVPSPRIHTTAIWTGATVLFFGGYTGISHENDCFSYSPEDYFTAINPAWAETYFGAKYRHNPVALPDVDADNDGTTNLQEFSSSTNPLDPLSGFASAITMLPHVAWRSVPGTNYRLLRKFSLNDPEWQVLVPSMPATGTSTSYLDFEGAAGKAFYKIEVLAP